MGPGLAKIIGKVRISRYLESPEIDLHIADNAWCINYADTWLSKQDHCLSKSRSVHRSTFDYGCEGTLQFYN